MELIFKVNNLGNGVDLVKYINFKEYYFGVYVNMMWEDFVLFVRQVIWEFVLLWIGKEIYNDLVDKFQIDVVLIDV